MVQSSLRALQNGAALIETLAMSVIVLVVAFHGVTQYQKYTDYQEMKSVYRQFVYTLSVARSEAKNRENQVVVCASSNSRTCDSVDFSKGWIAFIDDGSTNGKLKDGQRNGAEKLLVAFSQNGKFNPQIQNANKQDFDSITFNRKGYTVAIERLYASVYDPYNKVSFDMTSKIDRSGFISGVDHKKASQLLLAQN